VRVQFSIVLLVFIFIYIVFKTVHAPYAPYALSKGQNVNSGFRPKNA